MPSLRAAVIGIWSEFQVGLSIMDVLKDVYERELRFQLRDARPAYLVERRPGTGLVEAVFGLYPNDATSSYFTRAYVDVFRPASVEATPDTWTKVYMEGGIYPLGLTEYSLERRKTWRHDPKFFVFDPAKATDLIDLWNLRIEPSPVLPIPLDWWPELTDQIVGHATAAHRPLQGNAHGVMHRTTVEFARSIPEERQRECIGLLGPELPPGSLVYKPWRTAVWLRHVDDEVDSPRPVQVVAQERALTLTVSDSDSPRTEFSSLSPSFASLYGSPRAHARWVNVVALTSFLRDDLATLLPFNVTSTAWSRLAFLRERVVVGTEGWSFPQTFRDSTQTIELPMQEDAVVASLEHHGVSAKLSDAGQVAKQILQHLGGLNGLRLLASPATLKLLNAMAAGMRKRKQGEVEVEEVFGPRTRSEKAWRDHLAERCNRSGSMAIGDFPFHRSEREPLGRHHEVSEVCGLELAQLDRR